MFRVYVPDYPFAVFCVEDPRSDKRCAYAVEPVTWEFAPDDLPSKNAVLPAFERRIGNTTEIFTGVIGQSLNDPKQYRQARDQRNLDGFDILETPLLLMNWDAWITTSPKVDF